MPVTSPRRSPENQYDSTTVKRVAVGLTGKIGQTSWSWDAHLSYGKTTDQEGSPAEFTSYEESMAQDAVAGPNGPECRIQQAAQQVQAMQPGIAPTQTQIYNQALLTAEAPTAFNSTGSGLPAYLQAYQIYQQLGTASPLNPVSGLNTLQTLTALGAGCQPLNVLGSGPLQPGAAAYATGSLSLLLQVSQKDFTLNTSGEIWKGLGAGAWSLAAGYEWRSELLKNDFTSCPNGLSQATSADQLCLARTIDFAYQFGNAYGGTVIRQRRLPRTQRAAAEGHSFCTSA